MSKSIKKKNSNKTKKYNRKIDKSNTINEMKYYVFDSQSGGLTIYLLVKIINNNTVEIFSTNNEEYMDYMDYSENELTKLCSKKQSSETI